MDYEVKRVIRLSASESDANEIFNFEILFGRIDLIH